MGEDLDVDALLEAAFDKKGVSDYFCRYPSNFLTDWCLIYKKIDT